MGLNSPPMEYTAIELGESTELQIEYEFDPGDESPPFPAMVTLLRVILCQWNGMNYNYINLQDMDDTLFPVDFEAIEQIIFDEIQNK
jgi:hypothetical protein